MAHWNSSPHPISDIRDWSKAGRLELRPDFQRRAVWSAPARIMLMDTILRYIPMPKIFLANTIRDDRTYRVVIDGQQRISAILDFLRDEFSLEHPYSGEHKGKRFSQLDNDARDRFLSYPIDFNEAINLTDEQVREVFARVNKYTVPLNKQELRRADFPGDFLNVSEKLAVHNFFDEINIVTAANRRRYSDVEYISELLAAMIAGIQDKKGTLDHFYTKFAEWDEKEKQIIQSRFSEILHEISLLFDREYPISSTRFRQKSDFYTLFLVLDEFVKEGQTVNSRPLEELRQDLRMLQETIRPESHIDICSEYAIKCVSQANSASSRRWRHSFLKSILAGTYNPGVFDQERSQIFYRLVEELSVGDSYGMCPETEFDCPLCDQIISGDFSECVLGWRKSDSVNQINNSLWVHSSCIDEHTNLLILKRPLNDS